MALEPLVLMSHSPKAFLCLALLAVPVLFLEAELDEELEELPEAAELEAEAEPLVLLAALSLYPALACCGAAAAELEELEELETPAAPAVSPAPPVRSVENPPPSSSSSSS